jgi:hypothetical protein
MWFAVGLMIVSAFVGVFCLAVIVLGHRVHWLVRLGLLEER